MAARLAALFALALVARRAAVRADNPFTVRDNIKLKRLGDPLVDPLGMRFIFSATSYVDGTDQSDVRMYIADLAEPQNLVDVTEGRCRSPGNPVWTRDGQSIFFTCVDEAGMNAIWTTPANPIAIQKVSDLPVSVDNLQLTPDEQHVLFTAEVFFGMDLAQTAAEQERIDGLPFKAVLYKDPYIRHWDTWFQPDSYVHLFAATLQRDGESFALVDPHDLAPSIEGDIPLRPFGDRSQIAVNPAGTLLAFVTQTGPDRAWTTDDDLYVLDITDIDNPTGLDCLSCHTTYPFPGARTAGPVWGDDSTLFFRAMSEPASESDRLRVMRHVIGTSEFTALSDGLDRTVDGIIIPPSAGSTKMLLQVLDEGRERLVWYDTSDDTYTRYETPGTISGVNVLADERIVFSFTTYTLPTEIFLGDLGASDLAMTQLTTQNTEYLKGFTFAEPQEFYINDVQSFYFLPPGWQEGDAAPPMILYVHGGPESPWSDAWSYRWNPQVIATQGYSMVLTNFHGSDGWGENFTKSIRKNWFGDPYRDVIDGMNWMIEKGFGDPNRVGAMGASYGGTFMMWLNGHMEDLADPFNVTVKVIICHDGIYDLRAFGLDTEELFFPEREMGGPVYDPAVREEFERWNPAGATNMWRTPMLVIQGGQDFRIATNHGISAFQMLRRMGIESELLYFPTQSHWVYAPQESVVWHDKVLEWLDRYLKA